MSKFRRELRRRWSGLTVGYLAALALSNAPRAQCGDEVVLNELDAGTSEPLLRTPKGAPVVGGNFALRVERATPFTPGVLIYGGFENPTLHAPTGATVWPSLPWSTKFFNTNVLGKSPLLLNTPDVPIDLCGEGATFQALVFDSGAPGGLAITNAVRLRVGSVSEPLFFQGTTLVSDSGNPIEIAFGDMDGDALGDLVTLETEGADALVVRPGQLAGGFGAPISTLLTGITPSSLDLAFLDGDSFLDAVVANKGPAGSTNTDVSVLLGDGAGGFTGEVRYFSGKGSIATAIADLDEDGFLDIAVANSKEARFAVLFGDGNGAFGAPTFVPAGSGPGGSGLWDVEIADFDENGDLDLIAPLMFGDSISVVLGAGSGSFLPPMVMATQNAPIAVELGHLSGDGHVDFAISYDDAEPVGVRLGNGDGTFGAEIYPDQVDPRVVMVDLADMDGDLVDDLVYGQQWNDCVVVPSNGDGTFASRRPFLKESGLVCLSLVDVDSDGARDVLMGDSGVRILFGNGDGTLQSPPIHDAVVLQQAAAIGDVDDDGDTDLIGGANGNSIAVLLGNGDGTFGPMVTYPSLNLSKGVLVDDFDSDGALDVLGWGVHDMAVHLGMGDGTFGAMLPVLEAENDDVFAVDMNGDQILDLATSSAIRLCVLLGNGDGTFDLGWEMTDPFSPPDQTNPFHAVAVGHFDGDPYIDFAIGGQFDEDISILLNQGDGTFGTPIFVANMPNGISYLEAGDLDRDGDDDICVKVSDELNCLLSNGDATFAAPVLGPPGAKSGEFSLVDLDDDGLPDVLDASKEVRVFHGNGDGSFSAPSTYFDPGTFSRHSVGDVDLDGIPDLVLQTFAGQFITTTTGVAVVTNLVGE